MTATSLPSVGVLDPRRWYTLALLCVAFFMVILDASIVVVALPTIEADLSFHPDALQWVISAYALTYGGLLLLGGRAADLLGRRRIFLIGLVLFAVASALCGFAWSDSSLIVARAIQGIGAAALTPSALSIITTTFAEGSERNKALGIWAAIGGIGASVGWLIGGPITDGLGWEWIFFLNVPIAALALIASPALIRASKPAAGRRSYDPLGALTVTGALFLLVYGTVEAPTAGWLSTQTISLLGAAAVLLVVFTIVEARAKAPLIPLWIFRSHNLLGANAAMLLFAATAFGMPFILTLYAQQILGYSAVKFGLSSVVMPLAAVASSIIGQAIVTKAGFRTLAAVGMALLAAGCLLLTRVQVEGSYWSDVFPGLLVFGLGIGSVYVSVSIATLTGVRESEAGLASGLNNASFQIGGAVGVAILATVAVSRTEDVIAGGGADHLSALNEGFQGAFVAAMIFPIVGLVVALLLLRRPRPTAHQHEPAAIPATEPAVASDVSGGST